MIKKKNISLMLLAVATAAMLTACGNRNMTGSDDSIPIVAKEATEPENEENTVDGKSKSEEAGETGSEDKEDTKLNSDADDEEDQDKDKPVTDLEKGSNVLSQSVNHFAYELAGQSKENYFFSPYSICAALSMVDNAAAGNTKVQMEQALGVTDLAEWNSQISAFENREWPDKIEFTSANALWLSDAKELNDTAESVYLPVLRNEYRAELRMADFIGNKQGIADEINQWIEQNTDGMIQNLKTADSLSDETVADLINAVYFCGEWTNPFYEDSTIQSTFYGTQGETEIDMMTMRETDFGYYEADGLRSLIIPYGDGSAVMNIMIGENQDMTAGEIFAQLSESEKDDFLKKAIQSDMREVAYLSVPKFDMEYKMGDLKQRLSGMGITDMFDEGKADLTVLADDIFISDAVHVAKIEVDERGSRASAVTEFMMENTSVAIVEEPLIFNVDIPFLYLIRDSESGMILFMGQVTDF